MEGLLFGILRYDSGDMLTNKACTGPLTFKLFKNSPREISSYGKIQREKKKQINETFP